MLSHLGGDWASQVTQLVKNLPAMQETLVQFLGLEEGISFPGEGIDYPLQYSWVPMGTQMVKNLPGMQENWVQSWGDPLEEYRVTHSSFLPRESPGTGEH